MKWHHGGNHAQAKTTSASMTRGIIVIQRRAEVTASAFVFHANSLLIHAPIVSKRSMASAEHELARIWVSNQHEQYYWGYLLEASVIHQAGVKLL